MDLPLGSRGTLSCSAHGSPLPSIAWYKDGKRLAKLSSSHKRALVMIGKQPTTMSFRIDQRRHGSSSTLQLNNINAKHVGRYRCIAHNGGQFGGSDMAEAYVHLLKGYVTVQTCNILPYFCTLVKLDGITHHIQCDSTDNVRLTSE